MKFKVDDVEVYELTDIKKKIIESEISSDVINDHLKWLVKYIISHKYERCFNRFKKEWDAKLQLTHDSIPTDPDEYAQLVFDQKDYKDKKTKLAEEPSL